VSEATPKAPSPAVAGTSHQKKRKPGRSRIEHPATLLYVEWEDHHSQDAWVTEDEVEGDALLVKSIGWLLKETDATIVLYAMYAEESTRPYACLMTILKKSIKRRLPLHQKGLPADSASRGAPPALSPKE
jgi:hypothetical protein